MLICSPYLYPSVYLSLRTWLKLTLIQIFWSARIDPKKKAWLLIMFGGGIFVMMAGILRCALILTVSAPLHFVKVSS